MRRLGDYLLVTPQQLAAYLQEQASDRGGQAGEGGGESQLVGVPTASAFQFPTVLFCGEMSQNTQQALRSALPERSLFVGGAQAVRRAVSLAAIALQKVHEGHTDDPLTLEPLYLRRPSITKSTRKQPLLGDTTVENGRPQGTAPTIPQGENGRPQGTPQGGNGRSQGMAPTTPQGENGRPQGISRSPILPVSAGLHTIEREDGALRH
jgi:hypothetical protein